MIINSKETQAKTSLIDLLGGNSKSSTTKSSDLFSKLLATLSNTQQIHDFKAIIDPKTASLKTTTVKLSTATQELQSLLNGSEQKDTALFSKELINTLTNDQVRTLISRAKEYLKNEITAKNPEYQNETKLLPKTLAGLVKLADKMGLDPQSITLSVLKNDSTEQNTFTPELLSKPLFEAKVITQLSTMPKEPSSFESITQLISELKASEQKETKIPVTTASAAASTAISTDSTAASSISPKESSEKIETQPLKALLQHLDKREKPAPVSSLPVEEIKTPDAKPIVAAITTKTDALITLLQGESDLKDSKADRLNVSKTETESPRTIQAPKADSIEVKSKEAQQSMRLFANDLKEAVQEYKPPFTRLTMKLNPEKLGEVEVTLVQRGNNVHVNIQSNNTNSIAFLAHNATELKTQLATQGISNATMNFMSGGDGQNNQQTSQQKQHEQQQNRFRAYESLNDLELNNEQLSALEIIIPHYA